MYRTPPGSVHCILLSGSTIRLLPRNYWYLIVVVVVVFIVIVVVVVG